MVNNTRAENPDWFASWFDTPFYHILYKDRDYKEAQLFIENITAYLNLPERAKVLDLACGKGRHSVFLNRLGYDVTGADLSENSIADAKQFENESLRFVTHDMREPFPPEFDAVFNLFTSFGYFESENDNLITLQAIRDSLNEYGFGVIDFMNVDYVIANLVPSETKTVDDIEFHLKRFELDGYIYKEIKFSSNGRDYRFTEKVKALRLADFEELMAEAGIFLLDVFGDYKLKKYHSHTSERLIMIFK